MNDEDPDVPLVDPRLVAWAARAARHRWNAGEFVVVAEGPLGSLEPATTGPRALRCLAQKRNSFQLCLNPAGKNTVHEGAGQCWLHGGNTRRGLALGAWMMAHAFAAHLNVTPWEALLEEVKRSAGRVGWLDVKLSEAPDDDALAPGGDYHHWVLHAERERKHLAQVSKMAIDGGVAERIVAQAEFESQMMARVLLATLMNKELALSDGQVALARSIMRKELLAISSEMDEAETKVINGEVRNER